MDAGDDRAKDESVWATPPAPESQENVESAQSTDAGAVGQEGPTPPYGYGREFVRSLDPGTIGKLVEHEVAAMLEMAEDAAYWVRARALDAIKDAEARVKDAVAGVNEVQQGITGLAQELHDIVESVSRAAPALAAKEDASGEAPPSDVVEIPPSDEVHQDAPDQSR